MALDDRAGAPKPASTLAGSGITANTPDGLAVAGPPSVDALPPASRWTIAVYFMTMFVSYVALLAPTLFGLAFRVQQIDPENKEVYLGFIVGAGSAVGFVAGPLFGALSDRTRLAWGRRRPWIVGGIAAIAVAATVMAVGTSLVVVGAAWMLYTIGISAAFAAMNPVLADSIPSHQRGKVSAWIGVASQLSAVVAVLMSSMLTSNVLAMFMIPVAVFALCSVVYSFVVPDTKAPFDAAHESVWRVLTRLAFNPLKYRDFFLVLLGKFAMQTGMTLLSTYQLYFLLDRLGFTPESAGQQLAVIGGLGVSVGTIFALGGGYLSDKIERRKPFIYLAATLVSTGLAVVAFTDNFTMFLIASLLIVAGSGTFGSVDLALASDLVPEQEASGKWMGIYYAVNQVSNATAPVLAPLVLAIGGGGNYTVLYLLGAMVVLGAAPAARAIKSVR